MNDGPITDDKNTEIHAQENVSDSGSKYLSSQDIANFLSGRNVMAARQVDALCDMAKTDQMVQDRLTEMFNTTRLPPKLSMSDTAAFLNVIQKPEFKEIKDRFEKIGTVLTRSMEALEKDPSSLIEANDASAPDEKLYIKYNNETAKAMVCHKGFMDPIAEVSNLPPLNPQTVKSFEKALVREENKLLRIELQDSMEGTDKFSREIKAVNSPNFIK